MHVWVRAEGVPELFWLALYPTVDFSGLKTEARFFFTDFIVLYVRPSRPLLSIFWEMLHKNSFKVNPSRFSALYRLNNLTYSEVAGKTRRVSSTTKLIKFKLGTTNKIIFLLFNSMLVFYKKKHMCFFGSQKAILRCGVKSTYSRNGLFINESVRINRVGKLSTFR